MKIQMNLDPTITFSAQAQKSNLFDLDMKSTFLPVNFGKDGEDIASKFMCTPTCRNGTGHSFCCTCR